MKAVATLLFIAMLGIVATPSHAGAGDGPAVNYLSADAVYLNVGSSAGLVRGAVVKVFRDGAHIATLEVTHVSSHSASCRVIEQTRAVTVGDAVVFEAAAPPPAAQPRAETSSGGRREAFEPAPDMRNGSVVHGNVALQQLWQRDLDDTGLSSHQPSASIRLRVTNVAGTGGVLRVRHRSRLYHRSAPRLTEPDTDEWTHRMSEFGVYFESGGDADAIGFGRVINPYIRGIGYMDGGYASMRAGRHYRWGIAGGMDPDIDDSSMQPDRQKYGVFVAYERGTPGDRRIATTLAFSGSYDGGTIDREFAYLQTIGSISNRLNVYASTEVDINRDWRRDASGESMTFSNSYVSVMTRVHPRLALDGSYDARRNIRDYRTYETPDSLFDDVLSTGYSGGLSLNIATRVRMRARAGVRTREGDDYTNHHGTVSLYASNMPARRHSVSARLSVSETPYITGYRPSVTYRLPVGRRTRISIGAGAYRYDQDFDTTTSRFGEIGVHHMFGVRYYLSGDFRYTSGEDLNSTLLFLEAGAGF